MRAMFPRHQRKIVQPQVTLSHLKVAVAPEMSAQVGDIGFERIHSTFALN